MKLIDFIKINNITQKDASNAMGLTAMDVSRYCSGTTIPRAAAMRKIYEWSGGKVRPEDFYLTDSDKEKED